MNNAHAAAAAAHPCFHNYGIADLPRNLLRLCCRLDRVLGSWQNRHSRRCGQSSSGGFVSKQLEKIGWRTNEDDAGLFAGTGESRIFGKKTVTRVDGVDALLFCQSYDSRDVQIGFDRALASADLIRLVSLEAMQGEPVFLRINGHGAQAELVGGAEDSNGDFAAIGGEQFADRFAFPYLRGGQCVTPNSTLSHRTATAQLEFFIVLEQGFECSGKDRRIPELRRR